MMKFPALLSLFIVTGSAAQLKWTSVDSLFAPLPASVHVFTTTALLDGAPNIAYYVEADLADKFLEFTIDTTYQRRLTPSEFYKKEQDTARLLNWSTGLAIFITVHTLSADQ